MKGSDDFVIAVAARSYDAPNSFVAFKLLRWKLSIDCTFLAPGPMSQAGTHLVPTTGLGPSAVHVAEETLSPPVDVRSAGMEIYGPEATGEWGDEKPPVPADFEWKPG
jgi:hypothetical protein